jgi:DNA-nicking Smr family endonuclease
VLGKDGMVGRKKPRDPGGRDTPRRGKRRSIRFEAELVEDRLKKRRPPAEPPPAIHLRRLPADEALARLRTVVLGHARLGHKELLVVHGRGQSSPGGQSVLGPLVRQWCVDNPALVAAWRQAPAEWGGPGAIVITLR